MLFATEKVRFFLQRVITAIQLFKYCLQPAWDKENLIPANEFETQKKMVAIGIWKHRNLINEKRITG